ncbi:hypothetical protein LOK49_LG02G03147 [Camellia lanceoleosa]|uniref:Uncharacterized protein n=1 Tax=Camellia lanceoleosa TaxID=1840588 RepID=A0ACC0IRH4_9ERIC|nr:hypothetical protein LOK49_LG02G03147 [Camellia lanceoleosa]
MAFQSHILLSCLPIITFYILLATPCATALNFNIAKIGPKNLNVDITTNGDAYISSNGVHLAADKYDTNLNYKAGKATYVKPLHLYDSYSGKLNDFTTYFSFVIDSDGSSTFGDGLAFFLEPSDSSSTADTTTGGAIGLPIDPSTLEATSPFVAVEFDTFQNSWDPQSITPVTHLGININSIQSNVTKVWYNDIAHGIENQAVISYRSKSKKLSVVVASTINNAIVRQDLSFRVDLKDYLSEWVTIGFSAGTGDAYISKEGIQVTQDPVMYNVSLLQWLRHVYPTDASLGEFLRDPHRFQYQFLICHIGGNNYGERLAFFLAPNGSNIPLDSTGGGLGLVNEKETATSTSANRFVAVEFDTYRNNPCEASLPINHVGVCINSRNSIELIYWLSDT